MKKRIISILLAMSMVFTILPIPVAAASVNAIPSATKIMVNGKSVEVDAYTINQSNYIKLRDLAVMVNNTGKNFAISFDTTKNAIMISPRSPYTAIGGEMVKGDGQVKSATLSTSKVYYHGKEVKLTAYVINGSSYFKLRDVMDTMNVYVGWNQSTGTATLETDKSYLIQSPAAGEAIPASPIGIDASNKGANDAPVNISGDWIYYTDNSKVAKGAKAAGGDLYKIDKNGKGKKLLVSGYCNNIQVIGDWVYYFKLTSNDLFWRDVHREVYRVKTNGSSNQKVVKDTNDDKIRDFIVYGDWIFYAIEGPKAGMYRMKTNGTQRIKLFDDLSDCMYISNGRLYYRSLTARGNTWVNANGADYAAGNIRFHLFSMNLNGSDRKELNGESMLQFKTDGKRIYYVEDSRANAKIVKTLCSAAMDGSDRKELLAGVIQYVLNGDWIYYVENIGNKSISRMKKDGSNKQSLGAKSPVEGTAELTVFNNTIYANANNDEGYVLSWNGSTWAFVKLQEKFIPRPVANMLVYPAGDVGTPIADKEVPIVVEEKPKSGLEPTVGMSYYVASAIEKDKALSTWPDYLLEGQRVTVALAEFKVKIVKDSMDGWINLMGDLTDSFNPGDLNQSDMYIGVAENKQEVDAEIIFWGKTDNDSQRFKLEPAATAGQYYIVSKGGLYLQSKMDGATNSVCLTNDRTKAIPFIFQMEKPR